MQKLRLFVHRDHASDVLRAIQKLGAIQFEAVTLEHECLQSREKEGFEFHHASSRLDFAVRFLSNYAAPAGGLRGMIEGNKVRTSGTKLYETVKSFDYRPVVEAAQRIEESLVTAQGRLEELEAERTLLAPWRAYTEPLVYPRTTQRTATLFLVTKLPSAYLALEQALTKQAIPTHQIAVSETHRVLVYHIEHQHTVLQLLREVGIEPTTLPLRRGTIEEELERINRAVAHIHEDITREEARARALTTHLPELKILADYMLWQRDKHDLTARARTTSDVLVFEGWCPNMLRKELEVRITNKTLQYAIEDIEPAEGEVPPVELQNKGVFKPFEGITRLYGLPGHTDLDPTPYLAGFFFLFFGLALTDVGYGVILAAGLAYILLRFDVPKTMRPMLWLMFAGGISTALLGTLFGGYFGISTAHLPEWVRAIQVFDPMQNPMPVFYLALGLGVIQILAGLVLHIVAYAKRGMFLEGLLGKGPWIGVFVMGALWLGATLSYIPGGTTPYLYAIYMFVALIVLYAAYREPRWIMKPLMGILALYDIVAYFSDILSYSRLLALGLATSALAYAVNLIAGMVAGIPYVGLLLMVIILVVGHLFNLALNILGAFIHSARLQFVEFFGKFLEGSGRTYRPFKREERYVDLIDA